MTATPTPLRELLTQARREFRDSDAAGDVLDWLEERAALSARDEAGAVYRCDYCGSDYTRAKYCCQARREYLNAHGEYEIATPPASGEAVPMSELMEAQYELNELRAKLARYEAAVALPVDRYTFTLDGKIERSPTGEFVGYAEYRRLAAVAPAGMDDGYYIASFKNGRSGDGTVLWWMPDNAGYSSDLEQAGIYRDLMPGYHDNEYTVPVPVSFIRNLRVRRVVDYGDSLNTAFHSAKSLRAILAAAAPTPPATAGKE